MSLSEDLKPMWAVVTIRNHEGSPVKDVRALCVGGLVVHTPVIHDESGLMSKWLKRPQYTITHPGTGLKLGYVIGTFEEALKLAKDLVSRFGVTGEETVRQLKGMISLKQEVLRMQELIGLGVGLYQVPQWSDEIEIRQRVAVDGAMAFLRGKR